MTDYIYEPDTELLDWNVAIDNRYLNLLRADGIHTVADLLDIDRISWVNNTKGAGGKAQAQIAAAQQMLTERLSRTETKEGGFEALNADTAHCIQVVDGELSRPLCEVATSAAVARLSLINRAVGSLLAIQGVLNADEPNTGLAEAMVRALLSELYPEEAVTELVPRDVALRAIMSEFSELISADPVELFDHARWALDAITGNGWLLVRSSTIRDDGDE